MRINDHSPYLDAGLPLRGLADLLADGLGHALALGLGHRHADVRHLVVALRLVHGEALLLLHGLALLARLGDAHAVGVEAGDLDALGHGHPAAGLLTLLVALLDGDGVAGDLGHVLAVAAIPLTLLLVDGCALLLVHLSANVLVFGLALLLGDLEALLSVGHINGGLAHFLVDVGAGDLGDGGAHLDGLTSALLNINGGAGTKISSVIKIV